jgi:uncharacterized protein (UPF0333 family)
MKRGQATLELLLGFSIAIIVIIIAMVILFTFFPSVFSGPVSVSANGFSGLRVTGQGYLSNLGIYYIKFQNLLNENINVTGFNFLTSSLNQTTFSCTNTYISNLGFSECNFTVSLSSPFTAVIDFFYTPSNTSTHPKIEITGTVTG